MKRFTAAIFAIIYLLTTTGFVTDTHYCMGKVSGVEIDNYIKTSCEKCVSEKSCCRNEIKIFKVNSDHMQSSSSAGVIISNPGVAVLSNDFKACNSFYKAEKAAQTKIPPLILSNPLYLLNNVFRI